MQSEDLFDVAAVMLGTYSHCLDNDSAIQALSNIAECVKPQGLLILELGHPRDIFQGSFCSDGFVECWEVGEAGDVDFAEPPDDVDQDDAPLHQEQEEEEEEEEEHTPGMRVMVEYGREGDRFEIDRQVLHRTVGMSLFDVDGSLLSSTVETVEQRQFTLQEIDLLAKASGWHVCQPVYGDLDLNIPLNDEESHRMTVILQKKG
jgi:SAM-dependent methyltransferase